VRNDKKCVFPSFSTASLTERLGLNKAYKECKCCNHAWKSGDDFLYDVNTELISYQANFFQLQLGWLLFNHHSCRTTLAISVADMQDMYQGEIFTEQLVDTKDCPGYCRNKHELENCVNTKCECNYVREILQLIKNKKDKQKITANNKSNRFLR
jgi:hypothetical protein